MEGENRTDWVPAWLESFQKQVGWGNWVRISQIYLDFHIKVNSGGEAGFKHTHLITEKSNGSAKVLTNVFLCLFKKVAPLILFFLFSRFSLDHPGTRPLSAGPSLGPEHPGTRLATPRCRVKRFCLLWWQWLVCIWTRLIIMLWWKMRAPS